MEEKFGQFDGMKEEPETAQKVEERQVKEKLEKMHKKALDKQARGIHRSTKTLLRIFEPLHFKLREKIKWYYRWHTSVFSTILHWAIFLGSIVGLIYSCCLLQGTLGYKNQIPEKSLTISGSLAGSNISAEESGKNNIKIDKYQVQLEDKEITIGILKKKVDLGELASWKNVSYSADIPEGTSIVYRMKTSNVDKNDVWEKASWSEYYPISGNEIKTEGVPYLVSQYMQIEIALEGNKKDTPTLKHLKFGYSPFRENKVIAFCRDKIVSLFSKVFKFLQHREGM